MDDLEETLLAEIKAEQIREQLFERIVDLRDQGKSHLEIARLVGLSVREVWDTLHER